MVDVVLLVVLCLVPTISHFTTLPLVAMEPIRIALFAVMLLTASRSNTYVMAIALPVVSCLISGMPTPAIAGIMAVELSVNVLLFHLLSCRKGMKIFPAMLLSIVGAKAVYYLFKALLLAPVVLIGTALWRQALLAVVFAIVYALLARRRA